MTSESGRQTIQIEVVLAMPEKQELIELNMTAGSTIADAVERSGIAGMFDGFELDKTKVGVFGQKAAMQQELYDGDRVEIYRALIADPKEVRRQRALEQARE